MKVSLLNVLSDPNDKSEEFTCYACEVSRNSQILNKMTVSDLQDTDDIKTGIVINKKSNCIYPITDYVLSMFSDADLEPNHYISLLKNIMSNVPDDYKSLLKTNIDRIQNSTISEISKWNTEEMQYYDDEVNDDEKRKSFLNNIKTTPLWNIYIEREKYLINLIKDNNIKNEYILEIGCGNARTVSWIFSPEKYNYNYVGSDISLKRLILAKQVIAEGDFVQCSAFNLPFRKNTFNAVIAFGVLHHLPDPLAGMKSSMSVMKNHGHLLIHEPIEKPENILAPGKYKILDKFLEGGYEHSEHDNEIDIESSFNFFGNENATVKHVHYSTSALRTVFGLILSKISFLHRRRVSWNLLLWIDNIFIKLFCRKPNRLGPGAALLVVEKNEIKT